MSRALKGWRGRWAGYGFSKSNYSWVGRSRECRSTYTVTSRYSSAETHVTKVTTFFFG